MDYFGWIQLALFVGLLVALTKPMGLYLVQVLDVQGKPFLAPVIGPVERLLYFLLRVDPQKEQDWKQYTFALVAFSLVGALFTYGILRLQHILPLNPQGLGPVGDHLSFNTAVSFTTNTNWQSYGGESTMSYLSQMVGLAFHNFVSAAAGIAVARSPGAGHCTQLCKNHRQLLDGFDSHNSLRAFADLPCLCGVSRVARDDPKLQALRNSAGDRILHHSGSQKRCRRTGNQRRARQPGDGGPKGRGSDHCARANGLSGGNQDAGDQRRRFYQC